MPEDADDAKKINYIVLEARYRFLNRVIEEEKYTKGYEKSQFYEYYNRFVRENYGGSHVSMAVLKKTMIEILGLTTT